MPERAVLSPDGAWIVTETGELVDVTTGELGAPLVPDVAITEGRWRWLDEHTVVAPVRARGSLLAEANSPQPTVRCRIPERSSYRNEWPPRSAIPGR